MSEEEKKAIELLSKKNTEYYYRYVDVREAVSIVLNLIEKQQKELNNIKEIEKSHKEENGKLRVELEQEKVISEYWQDRFLEQVKYGNKITVSGDPVIIKNVIDTVTYDYIHKDKIKEKIKELQEESKLAIKEKDYVIEAQLGIQIYILEELLEDK